MTGFALSFEGNDAADHRLDFYDAAHALVGFQRSLAVTTHLVLNGEVITQAPSLKNARIVAIPPEKGSWKILAVIAASAGYALTAPIDTPIGHIVRSAYDYVISETLGFHVDYSKTLGQQYKELKQSGEGELPILDRSQLDSVIEKCEFAIKEMHRPIVKSKSASMARISYLSGREESRFRHPLNVTTYENIEYGTRSDYPEEMIGRVQATTLIPTRAEFSLQASVDRSHLNLR